MTEAERRQVGDRAHGLGVRSFASRCAPAHDERPLGREPVPLATGDLHIA